MRFRPDLLKNEARDEAYKYFDENIRPLKKDTSGKVDPSAEGLVDNDVDAFRHAYVSGVFTLNEALKNNELIIDPKDGRRYEGQTSDPINKSKPIVVLKEDENGRNELFFDLVKNSVFSREEFIAAIQSGLYPTYTVKIINGLPTPASKPDSRETNNLS